MENWILTGMALAAPGALRVHSHLEFFGGTNDTTERCQVTKERLMPCISDFRVLQT